MTQSEGHQSEDFEKARTMGTEVFNLSDEKARAFANRYEHALAVFDAVTE